MLDAQSNKIIMLFHVFNIQNRPLLEMLGRPRPHHSNTSKMNLWGCSIGRQKRWNPVSSWPKMAEITDTAPCAAITALGASICIKAPIYKIAVRPYSKAGFHGPSELHQNRHKKRAGEAGEKARGKGSGRGYASIWRSRVDFWRKILRRWRNKITRPLNGLSPDVVTFNWHTSCRHL